MFNALSLSADCTLSDSVCTLQNKQRMSSLSLDSFCSHPLAGQSSENSFKYFPVTRMPFIMDHVRTLGIHVVYFCSPGACWTSGFLAISSASVEMSVIFSYIFCISATLQGFLIFILMTARDANVRKFWMETFSRRKRQILGESTNNKIRLNIKYV